MWSQSQHVSSSHLPPSSIKSRRHGGIGAPHTCSDILGVLIARVSGRPLPEFLAERLFEPLGMADTGFEVPAGKLGRGVSLRSRRSGLDRR